MGELKSYPYIDAEPWNISVDNRSRKLDLYQSLGFKNVVYLAEWGDQSTFRYRAYNMTQALLGSDKWKGTFFYKRELSAVETRLEKIDCIVLVRYPWDLQLDLFLNKARQRQIPLIYDVDDYIFDIRALESLLAAQGILQPTQLEMDSWFNYVSRIYQAADRCDTCLTTNGYLAELLMQVMHKKCFVLKNFFNIWQYKASECYYRQKLEGAARHDGFVLGYFSGSNTHREDLAVAMNDLKEAFEIYPDWKLLIVGYMEFNGFMKKLKEDGRIQLVPIQNFIDLQRYIAEVDLNLIPLTDNRFTNSKSELKFFEAGLVGTVSCASPTYIYKKIITDGGNGYLCEADDWFFRVTEIYRNALPQNMMEAARKTAIEQYAYFNQTKKIEAVLDQVQRGGAANG